MPYIITNTVFFASKRDRSTAARSSAPAFQDHGPYTLSLDHVLSQSSKLTPKSCVRCRKQFLFKLVNWKITGLRSAQQTKIRVQEKYFARRLNTATPIWVSRVMPSHTENHRSCAWISESYRGLHFILLFILPQCQNLKQISQLAKQDPPRAS